MYASSTVSFKEHGILVRREKN